MDDRSGANFHARAMEEIGIFLGQILFEFLGNILIEGGARLTGWLVVPLFTGGYVLVEPVLSDALALLESQREFDFFQTFIISGDAGSFWGLFFWCALGSAMWELRRRVG